MSQANGAADAATELTAESVKLRVAELFPAGATAPAVKPRLPPVAATPTGKLACLSFDAAKTVKLTRGKLAREEAAGYILADLLGIELLPGEAMRLGESVRKAAIAAKDGESALKNAASAKRSSLRKQAAKDSQRAAGLDAALQMLDAALAKDLVALQATPITLNGLPDRSSKIVEPRVLKPRPEPAAEPVQACGATVPCHCGGKCPRARAHCAAARSHEAGVVIFAAYGVNSYLRGGEGWEGELEIAEVMFKHALKALVRKYPDLTFSELSVTDLKQSAHRIIGWTAQLASWGEIIPTAVRGAKFAGVVLHASAAAQRQRELAQIAIAAAGGA